MHLYYNKRKESLKWIGGCTVEVVFRVCGQQSPKLGIIQTKLWRKNISLRLLSGKSRKEQEKDTEHSKQNNQEK